MGKLTNLDNLDKLSKALDARYKELINEEKARALAEEQALQAEINVTKDMFGGKSIRYVTQAEYDALTEEERNSSEITYFITDAVDLSHDHENKEFLDNLAARNIAIGNKSQSFDGVNDLVYSIEDIGAAPAEHNHDNNYYTEGEIDLKLEEIDTNINEFSNEINAEIQILNEMKADSSVVNELKTEIQDMDEEIFKTNAQLIVLDKYKANKDEIFSGSYNDLTDKPFVHIPASEYSRMVINGEVNNELLYINEHGNVNEFVFDTVKDEYENKAIIKSNNVYSVVDINVEEYSIDASVQEIYFNLNSNNVCKKIIAQDDCVLEKIEVHNSVNLQRIHLLNQVNEEMMLKLAENLIDRNDIAWGSIIIKDQELRKKVEDKFIRKDWFFGSPKIYDSTEKTKIQQYMYDSGIVDIWESGEYGEDATVGIIDSGLRLDAVELDYDNCIGATNLSSINGKLGLESVSIGNSTVSTELHGTCVATILAGKGVKYYGVCPKCKWHFIKIADEDGYGRLDAMTQAPIVAMQHKLEFCTMSYSSSIIGSDDYPAYSSDKLYYDLLREYVEDFNGVFNTSVKNQYGQLQAYKWNSTWKPANATHAARLVSGVYRRIDTSTSYNTPFTSYTYIHANAYNNAYSYFNGASCATPVLTGIFMLVSNIYRKKYGRRPNKYELVEWLKNRTVPCRNYSGVLSEEPTLVGYGLINVMAFRDVSHIVIPCIEREDE